jgi:alkanesulfonate monooxygenase SsuD/methylene tetrahydromethanopterin reductase-like flavin-dependent oxidoreductase (luciferase family)
MDFGIFDHVERQSPDLHSLYEGRLNMLEVADRVGFYCYHVAEHQGTPLSMAPSPSLLLAAAAERTERIKLGALCYILPLYEPLRLALEICMLDQLSNGRMQVGIGRGVSPIELGFFNVDPKITREVFEEDLEVIKASLTNSALTFEGKYHSYNNVPIELTPIQKPYPPFWYPTSGMGSVPWVAENGFHTIFMGAPGHVAEQTKCYLDNLPASVDRDEIKYGMWRYVFVAPTDAEAMALAEPAYHQHLENLHHLGQTRGRPAQQRAAVPDTVGAREGHPSEIKTAVEKGWAAVGSPATVIEQIADMQSTTLCNYLVYNPLCGDTTPEQGARNVELFGAEVIPALRDL